MRLGQGFSQPQSMLEMKQTNKAISQPCCLFVPPPFRGFLASSLLQAHFVRVDNSQLKKENDKTHSDTTSMASVTVSCEADHLIVNITIPATLPCPIVSSASQTPSHVH